MHIGTGRVGQGGHDVDGTGERRTAKYPSGGSFQNLDALNLADIHGEVKGIVSRLRVADVDAVEQDSHLLVVASADADVCLRANGSSLSHIHSCNIFEQVVNTLHWSRLNIALLQYSNHSRSLTFGQGRP